MVGVLEGFAVIGAIILLGYLLAAWGILDEAAQRDLARLVFYAATPALLYTLLAGSELDSRLTIGLAVGALSAAAAALAYVLLARLVFREDAGTATIGALASCYVNAGNLGLPICVFVLGDGAAIAPILLLQLLVIAPLAFWVLDAVESRTSSRSPGAAPTVTDTDTVSAAGHALGADRGAEQSTPLARRGPWRRRWAVLLQPLRNPVTIGSFLGVVVSASGLAVPSLVTQPVEMIANIAVPGALLAYGISLRVGPRALAGPDRAPALVASALKLLFQPAVAAAIGAWGFGLHGTGLLTVTLVAGLPSAQNVFIYAMRYGTGTVLARDAVFVTTTGCLVTLMGIVALLH